MVVVSPERPGGAHADSQAGDTSPLDAAAPRSHKCSDERHQEVMDFSSCKATSTEMAGLPVQPSGRSRVCKS